jgi:hypothetical protein
MNSGSRFCTILDWRGLTLATFAALAVAVDLSSSQAEIIPVDRRISWSVGIPGGIPVRTNIFASVKAAPYSARGDGITDDTAAIQSAVNACPAGQVLLFPAGKYNVSSTITITKGIVLRGEGMDATIIRVSGSPSQFFYVHNAGNDWNFGTSTAFALTAGLQKGSTNITVASNPTAEWSVGDIILIDQVNDLVDVTPEGYNGATCSYCSRGSGTRNQGQFVEVLSVSSTGFTFDPPLFMNYSLTQTPQAIECKAMVKNVGFESLQITNVNPSLVGVSQLIGLTGASYWWMKDCMLAKADMYLFKAHNTYRGEVRGCVFRNAYNPGTSGYGPDHGYGMLYSYVNTSCLFEDNVLHDLHVAIATQGPSSGHVIAYNFVTNTWDVDLSVTQPDIIFHSAHAHMVLIEGNSVLKINADNMNGSSGYNTIFRNRVRNKQGTENYLINAIELMAHQHYYNIVGNILGTRGFERYYETEGVDRSEYLTPSIYRFGYWAANDEAAAGNDARVKGTILRHGNWDTITTANSGVVWDAAIADHSIPASLYLSGKPSWWGSLAWPPFGPDLTPKEGPIPAQLRYDAMAAGVARPATPTGLRVVGP